MRGLFLKDYYLLIKRCRSMLIIMALAVIMPAFSGAGSDIWNIYPVLVLSMLPMTFLAYDERDRWDQYASALPYSKKDIVAEKYLFGLLISVIASVLSIGLGIAISASRGELDIMRFASLAVILLSVCLFAPAVMLPFIFKFGVEKGRIAYYIIVCGTSGVVFALSAMGKSLSIIDGIGKWISVLVLPVCVVLYVLSVIISVKLFERRKN